MKGGCVIGKMVLLKKMLRASPRGGRTFRRGLYEGGGNKEWGAVEYRREGDT